MKYAEIFLNTQKIDIPLVSELHFTERSDIKILAYTTYATNSPDGTAHAGPATIIRKDIKCYELAKYETDHIQATNVSIGDWDRNLITSAVYCPPRHAIKRNNTINLLTQ
jgi:hypothetical protein